jgi:hypothetical protein
MHQLERVLGSGHHAVCSQRFGKQLRQTLPIRGSYRYQSNFGLASAGAAASRRAALRVALRNQAVGRVGSRSTASMSANLVGPKAQAGNTPTYLT